MRIFIWLLSLLALATQAQSISDGVRLENPEGKNTLYIALKDSASSSKNVILRYADSLGFRLVQGLKFSETDYHNLSERALRIRKSDESVQRLKRIYTIEWPDASNEKLLDLAQRLEKLPMVRYCSFVSAEPIVPPGDIPPQTPNYRSQQLYYGPNPGINMEYAHSLGLIGTGFRIRNVEYGFNKEHEEFADSPQVQIAPGMTMNSGLYATYKDHGTATTGVLVAHNGDYGVTGLLYGASEYLLFPEWQESGYNRILAIETAIANSTQGDLIVFEMQTYGQTATGYVMQEFNAVSWDLTRAATDSGILIVAAGGNGNQNLDSEFYEEYRSRGDSGAIIVGAGTPDLSHSKVWYSNYGSRIDLQGWGSLVLSTGYGEFATIGGDYNQQYTNFEGTSSATPLVAACALALQQYHFEQTGDYLIPQDIRSILIETGIPQGSGGSIGPLPNMEAALQRLQEQLSVPHPKSNWFTVYPNPVQHQLHIHGDFQENAVYTIFDMLGQVVMQGLVSPSGEISLAHLSKGLYAIHLQSKEKSLTKKVLKN